MSLRELLEMLVETGGSDLHLKVGSPPTIRRSGELVRLGKEPLRPDDILPLVAPAMTEEHRTALERERDVDFAVSIPGLARFRASLFHQRGSVSAVFRSIPFDVSTLPELGLPPQVAELASLESGLVLVTGPTGSGKSTTLAAMVDHINSTRRVHIITLEDPIEFVHRDRTAVINQRQVGLDVPGFAAGVIRSLRHDPDVILIGEMRDLETIEAALTASETGHLVLGTLHTAGAVQTVDRILDIFPEGKQALVRVLLAQTLRGVLSQRLLPAARGGRVPIMEVLVGTRAVRAMIREGKTHQLESAMQSGASAGMRTMRAALREALELGLVSGETAEDQGLGGGG